MRKPRIALLVCGLAVAACSSGGTSDAVRPPAPTISSTATSNPTDRGTVEAREDSPLTSTSRLRLDGIGPVRIGMTTTEASRASGKPIRVDPASSPHPSSCAFATVEGGPHIAFMVISDRIQRVDVGPESSVRTVSGVGIGDSEGEVQRIYGDRTRVKPHPYNEEGRYLIYDSDEPSQHGLLLIFETDGTRVTSFRAGERGAVEAPEGCV